jgi:cyclase
MKSLCPDCRRRIKTINDIRETLRAGADNVTINTTAVERAEFVREASEIFGSQCICVAIDAKRRENGFEVYTYGGRKPTGVDAVEWAKQVEALGAGEFSSPAWTETAPGSVLILILPELFRNRYIYRYRLRRVAPLKICTKACSGKGRCGPSASIFHYREHTVIDAKKYLRERGVKSAVKGIICAAIFKSLPFVNRKQTDDRRKYERSGKMG